VHKLKASPNYLTGYSTRDTIGVLVMPTPLKTIEEMTMSYKIETLAPGLFQITHPYAQFDQPEVYTTLPEAKVALQWYLDEERFERRAERAYEQFEKEHCDE